MKIRPYRSLVVTALALSLTACVSDVAFTPDSRTFEVVAADVRSYYARPRSQDAAVIAELRRNANVNPPIYLVELARRLIEADEEEALYFVFLATARMLYDAKRCQDDRPLAAFFDMADKLPEQTSEFETLMAERRRRSTGFLAAHREVLERGEMFGSEASPWWICSHGSAPTYDWLKPRSEWRAIREEITTDLRKSIQKAEAARAPR